MNTKNSKGIIGITLALIMIASVFAAIAPSTTADVKAAADFSTAKETLDATGTFVDPTMTYQVGDTVHYIVNYTNTDPTFNCTLDLWDIFPDGTIHNFGNDIFFTVGQKRSYTVDYIVKASDVQPPSGLITYNHITNTARAQGLNGNSEVIDDIRTKISEITEEFPPVFNFTWEAIGCFEVEFNGSYTADLGVTIVNHTWYFGDTTNSGVIAGPPGTITHTYSTCSVKTVTLSGWADNGLSGSFPDLIYVDCGPTAIAYATPSCFEAGNDSIIFNGSASHADLNNTAYPQSIVNWSWSFSDSGHGSSDNAAVTSRVVNDTVTATLTVRDSLGCEATTTVPVGPCSMCNIRIYGTYDHGAGKLDAEDPYTLKEPENKPYSDPIGPFYPQSPEAPRKDFITFNPAIMDSNWPGYGGILFTGCDGIIQRPAEKVFKRMWYEKDWFKDYNNNGEWDIVTSAGVMNWSTWLAYPQWARPTIIQSNNPEDGGNTNADIYAPAIIQEFTYMTLDSNWQPALIEAGGQLLIPLAHDPSNPYRGLNSFDADGDGIWDPVRVESEKTLNLDIDGDGLAEPMNNNTVELDGDEQVVFVLGPKDVCVSQAKPLQFFDHAVILKKLAFDGTNTLAQFEVRDNEGGSDTPRYETTNWMKTDDVQKFYRGKYGSSSEKPAFYIKVLSIDLVSNCVSVEVGRMFGQTYANIEANKYRAQKVMIVDQVFYNVVAIKAEGDCFKYITFRQKLPKADIKIFGKHLKTWGEGETLPELPPFNLQHKIVPDINPIVPEQPPYPIVKIPNREEVYINPKYTLPPLDIVYVDESHELRYKGELKEIYNETESASLPYEYWNLEWYWTLPWQYTEFRLPKNDRYLVTLSWVAPEAESTLWDGVPNPVGNWTGERFKFWYEDCTGPLYINRTDNSIRLYGTFGEGAGNLKAKDVQPGTSFGVEPENKPYTDPVGPFYPQSAQAPKKDFMTFNPAIMHHNQGYPELDFVECTGKIVQVPKEKVFKRMWYEKEWFKDYNRSGAWDVVIEQYRDGPEGYKWYPYGVMTMAQWDAMPDYLKIQNKLRLKQSNNPENDGNKNADIYAPAIMQEFTYMTVDSNTMPIMVQAGSEILIPLAHDPLNPYRGLNSFDADGDGVRDAVRVESEQTLDLDIDADGFKEPMNNDTVELNGNEQVVFVLGPKDVSPSQPLQFFDFNVTVKRINAGSGPTPASAYIILKSNQGDGLQLGSDLSNFFVGETRTFGYVPISGSKPCFYIKVLSVDIRTNTASVEVGRMFGQTHANIEQNDYRAQKVLMVDQVFYNIVAVKTEDNCFKYITFRQKLPKEQIKIFNKELKPWGEGETLPELPPFNLQHEILVDVLAGWGPAPVSQQDKIGTKVPRPPLNITYVNEDEEWRFLGELKEIYNETRDVNGTIETEYWNVEWFHTLPMQYTAFVVPDGELYLMTLAWVAPEAEITLWDGVPNPVGNWTTERVKFWYDPMDDTDIYINRVGELPPVVLTIADYYNMPSHGGDGIPHISTNEIIKAVMDYLTDLGPFAPGSDPHFTKTNLLGYLMDYLAQ